jgi:hypothetical protein
MSGSYLSTRILFGSSQVIFKLVNFALRKLLENAARREAATQPSDVRFVRQAMMYSSFFCAAGHKIPVRKFRRNQL